MAMQKDSDVIMEHRRRLCSVARVSYAYLKAVKLGRLTPLWRVKNLAKRYAAPLLHFPSRENFTRLFFARTCENGISARMAECTSGMRYINVARERRAFKGSRKRIESYGDKNTKIFPRTDPSYLYCCCWQLAVSVFFICAKSSAI